MNVEIPSRKTYCTGTMAEKAQAFTIKGVTIFFSYSTPVAYEDEYGVVCSRNNWGPTTGKHLHAIEPDRSKRINYREFLDRLQARIAAL
jgi:hypothetical protein